MSDEAKSKKKGGKGKLMVLLALGIAVGGAGTAGGLYASGAFSKEEDGPKEDPNKPVLVLKGESPDDVAAAHGGGDHGGGGASHGAPDNHGKGIDLPTPANTSKYQATYYQVPAPFTSNMIDTDSFAQISIAVGTYYDGRVVSAIKGHEMAIRSALLMLLAQQQEVMLATPEGKEALQAKLKMEINRILKQKTGYGGVDNVYFTNFVIQ